eukprot:g42524.t1
MQQRQKLLEDLSRSGSICGQKPDLMIWIQQPFFRTDGKYVSGGSILLEVVEMVANGPSDVDAGGIVEMETDVEEGKEGIRDGPGEDESRMEFNALSLVTFK